MKQRFTLFIIISCFSLGVFGQVYTEFTPAQKPKSPERPSAYHALLDAYKAFQQNTLRKSATDLSTYLDTAEIQLLLQEDQYLPIISQIITYDISGKLTNMRTIVLNDQTFQWENSSKTEYSYDINGNISQVVSKEWNVGSSTWIPVSKTEYSYDANDNLIQILDYEWGQSVGQYLNSRKVTMTLDENGLETLTLVSFWDANEGQWVESWKYEYNYDPNDALLLETEYAWDNDASDWVFSWKTDYTYNEDEQLTTKEEYNWDSQTSLWTAYWESIITYDAGGNVYQQIDSEYLLPGGTWQEQWKGVYTFDEQNNPLTEIYSQWDEAATQLAPTAKYEYVYDPGTLLSELVVPPISWFVSDYRQQIVSKPLGYISYDYNSETPAFEVYYQEVYYFNEHHPTNVIGSETSRIASIFPNPVREHITLNFAGEYHEVSFELYDVTGRRVIQTRVENGESLNLEGLQNGIYLYRISADEQIQTGKLLKK
ncbi:MAG: T9SS type A sorting domain-containing protein [Bacteroidia bacterium]|nr:MAG: T9SS type A sorting domain-containing protein [Bacteroidia bacterium]